MKAFCFISAAAILMTTGASAQTRTPTPKPLETIFACKVEAPGAASNIAADIQAVFIQEGISTGMNALASYNDYCFVKKGSVTNPDYLKKARFIGRGGNLNYYVINFNEFVSFGVIGSAQ